MSEFDIVIIKDKVTAEKIAKEIRQSYAGPVGFDTETELSNNRRDTHISLIQIYVPWTHRRPVCYLFHVGQWNLKNPLDKNEFPTNVRQLITSKSILKFIAAPENDSKWFSSDFGITMAGYIDVQTLATLQGHDKIGLDSLAEEFIPNWVNKNKKMRNAKWSQEMTSEMIEYATNDAYASYEIAQYLAPMFFNITTTISLQDTVKLLTSYMAKKNEQLSYDELLKVCNELLESKVKNPQARKRLSCEAIEYLSHSRAITA